MPTFLDSTPIIDDLSALRDRMQRDGHLFVSGLLPADELEALRLRFLAIARDAGWIQADTPLEDAIADQDGFCVEPTPEYMDVYSRMYALPEFHALQPPPRARRPTRKAARRPGVAASSPHRPHHLSQTRILYHAAASGLHPHSGHG